MCRDVGSAESRHSVVIFLTRVVLGGRAGDGFKEALIVRLDDSRTRGCCGSGNVLAGQDECPVGRLQRQVTTDRV